MIRLYEPADFETLASWVTDADMLFQFAGTEFSFPLTEGQVLAYQAKYPDRHFYMGYIDGVCFSFGEIIPQENSGPRLGRLLIGDPGKRGLGLGMFFIHDLIEECERLYHAKLIELYVWENNIAAVKCYTKIGFDFVVIDPFKIVHNGEEYNLLKMRFVVVENNRV